MLNLGQMHPTFHPIFHLIFLSSDNACTATRLEAFKSFLRMAKNEMAEEAVKSIQHSQHLYIILQILDDLA